MKNTARIVTTLLLASAMLAALFLPLLSTFAESGHDAWRNNVDPKLLEIMNEAGEDELIPVLLFAAGDDVTLNIWTERDARLAQLLDTHKGNFLQYVKELYAAHYLGLLEKNLADLAEEYGVEVDDFGIEIKYCDEGIEIQYFDPCPWRMQVVTDTVGFDYYDAWSWMRNMITKELYTDFLTAFIEENIGSVIDQTLARAFDGTDRTIKYFGYYTGTVAIEATKSEIATLALLPQFNTRNTVLYYEWDKQIFGIGDSPAKKGDINGDNVVDISDIIALRDIIFGSNTAPAVPLEVADINGDGLVNVDDILALRDIIFA
ncbi:MAG: dockerin type I repeat-containing protein [Clostridia bacterium]|nr:dockerin type I repeat-containing protein [Clostridia bacterium]